MRIETVPVYHNEKQIEFLNAKPKIKTFIGGRGGAKSFTIGSNEVDAIEMLPGAVVALLGPTYQHLKNNTMPSVLESLKLHGHSEFKKGNLKGTFVQFRKPPVSKHWKTPYHEISDYENVITFYNGYTIVLVSWYDAKKIRGFSFDGARIDEAALLSHNTYSSVIIPAIRGNSIRFKNNPYHQQILKFTSMPWLSEGMWVLDDEEKAKLYPDKYHFTKCTSKDNVHIITQATLDTWKREMLPLEYQVEVMCEKIDRVANCYYDRFEEHKHCYVPLVELERNEDLSPKDFDSDEPLYFSFDFNAGFMCCLVAQKIGNEIRFVRELFIKGQCIIDDLVKMIVAQLKSHKKKFVYIYGDNSANKRMTNSLYTDYQSIRKQLSEAGWESELKVISSNPEHKDRNQVINKVFSETYSTPRIKINKRSCIYLSICLKKTSIELDFKKDKRSEKDGITPPELSTHLTDAFDYLVYPLCVDLLGSSNSSDIISFF